MYPINENLWGEELTFQDSHLPFSRFGAINQKALDMVLTNKIWAEEP